MDGLANMHTLQAAHSYVPMHDVINSSSRSVTLSIRPLAPVTKVLRLGPILRSDPEVVNVAPHVVPLQGPNTHEYFGHDGAPENPLKDAYQLDIRTQFPEVQTDPSDIMDTPYDPYDNTTSEQKFCGGYGEWGHVINRTERTILPDLKLYPFPDDIKNQADVIYNKMKYQVRRGKIRFQMLFFCVYCSHLELKRDVNPIQLGAQFGLTPGEVQKCDSLFSPLQTGYKPPSKNASPLGYLPDYIREMDLSEDLVGDIMAVAADILRKDPTLNQENPQTVAAGLLRYYTFSRGITSDDPSKINRVTNRSNVTIDGMFRRISTIDNS